MKKTFKSILFATLGVFAFTCCEDVPAPYQIPGTEEKVPDKEIQPAGTGTLEDPYNVAGVVAFINTLQADTESEQAVYIKGKVASNTTSESTITQYGNMTFTMIDEGNKSTTFTAFQVYGPGKKKFTAVTDIKVGDEVVVYGKVVNYKGTTPETVGKGAAYVYSINSENGGGGGTSSSTKETPLSIAQAKTSNGNNYVKGYIVGYIDGTKLEEGAKFAVPTSAETEILLADTPEETDPANVFPVQLPSGAIRDALELSAHPDNLKKEVLLYGSLETYFGVTGMKSTSWGTIDGKSFGKDPDNTNIDTATPQGNGTKEIPYNVAGAIKYVTELGADVTSNSEVYVKGTVKSNNTTEATITQYGNMSFVMIDKGFENAEFQAYQVYGPGNKKFTSASDIKVGDEVIVYGKVVNYKGNTPETTGKGSAYVYSLNGNTDSDDSGNGGGGDNDEDTSEYATSLSYGSGNFLTEGIATINGVANCKALKIGTTSKAGDFTLTVPAGKHSFYAVTWKGTAPADVVLKNGETVIKTVTVQPNDGATGNSPYTITVTEADKYEFEVSADCTVTVTSDKRIIFFGIK